MLSRTIVAAPAVAVILLLTVSCRPARISGTYLDRGRNFVSRLELTQTDGGQVTGVLNTINLHADGKIDVESEAITAGAFDGEQLTLTFHPGAFGTNLAGTVKGNTIRLQTVGSNGAVLSWEFQRTSANEFKKYADQLRLRAGGVLLSGDIVSRTQEMRRTIQAADGWISNAELHAERVPTVKSESLKIDDEMRTLVARERVTTGSLARGQISLRVGQGNLAGNQIDLQVNQIWDLPIVAAGRSLSQKLATYSERCWPGAGEQYRKNGADSLVVADWEKACHEVLAAQTRLRPIYERITQQRGDLINFQAAERSRRQELVDEASRIQ